jgi:hypothetical protein
LAAILAVAVLGCHYSVVGSTINTQPHPQSRKVLSSATPLPGGAYGCEQGSSGNWTCSSNCSENGITMTCDDGGNATVIDIPPGSGSGSIILDPTAPGFEGGASGYKGPFTLTNTQKRWARANLARGDPTTNGPSKGKEACLWELQQLQIAEGLKPFDVTKSTPDGTTYVPALYDWLNAGNGTSVSQSDALAGDLVLQGDYEHVGVCLTNGCTEILSNENDASGGPCFCWVATPTQFETDPNWTVQAPNLYFHVTAPGSLLMPRSGLAAQSRHRGDGRYV